MSGLASSALYNHSRSRATSSSLPPTIRVLSLGSLATLISFWALLVSRRLALAPFIFFSFLRNFEDSAYTDSAWRVTARTIAYRSACNVEAYGSFARATSLVFETSLSIGRKPACTWYPSNRENDASNETKARIEES